MLKISAAGTAQRRVSTVGIQHHQIGRRADADPS